MVWGLGDFFTDFLVDFFATDFFADFFADFLVAVFFVDFAVRLTEAAFDPFSDCFLLVAISLIREIRVLFRFQIGPDLLLL